MNAGNRLTTLLAVACLMAAMLIEIGSTGAQDRATPIPLPACDPTPDLRATPQPDDEDQFPFGTMITRESIQTLVSNLISCRNDRNWDSWLALVTPELLEQVVGTTESALAKERFERLADLGYLPNVMVVSVEETEITHRRGVANTVVTWLEGPALKRERWSFAGSFEGWKLTKVEPLLPLITEGAVGLVVEILDGSILTTRHTIMQTEMVIFEAVNLTADSLTFTIYANPERLHEAELVDELAALEGRSVSLVAFLTVPAEETRFLPVVDLPAGDYALVVESGELWRDSGQGTRSVWLLTVSVLKE